jgi:hypothetical protein
VAIHVAKAIARERLAEVMRHLLAERNMAVTDAGWE